MSKIVHAADILAVQHSAFMVSATSAAGAWWMAIGDISAAVFGQPLQVVLAAAAGAYAGCSFVATNSYFKTLGSGILWTIIGIYLATFGVALANKVAILDATPGNVAGVALVISWGCAMLVTEEYVNKLKAAAGRFIDNLFKGGQS